MSRTDSGVNCSIVVPVYNSEQTLPQLHERLVRVMEGLGETFEILFVEDCGTDSSWQVLQSLAHRDERVQALQLLRNYGQASATMCGLAHSRGEVIITMDDDLQNPPEEIPTLVQALRSSPELDAVIGIPEGKRHALWRRLASDSVNLINSWALRKDRSLKFSSFRIMRRLVVDRMVERMMPQPAIGALLYSTSPRIANIRVRHEPRPSGKSGYTIAKMFGLAISNFLAFSSFPLRLLAITGLIGIIVSVGLGIRLMVKYFMGGTSVPGWMTQVLLLVGISGFNFFALGLIGEYLLRILQSAQQTPQYVVRRRVGGPTQKKVDSASC